MSIFPHKTLFRRAAWLLPLLLSATAWADCVKLSGEARQGALLWGRAGPQWQQAWLDGEALNIVQGIVVLGFGRDDRGRDDSGSAELRFATGDRECVQTLNIQRREYPLSRVDGVPPRTVQPGPEHRQRILRERELVRRAKANSGRRVDFAGGFQWPLTGPISGVYGSRRIYNGVPGNPHYGVDVARPLGTPVGAPAAGVVVLAEPDLFYSGGTVIIDHGSEVSSSLLHLSEVSVAVGAQVAPGDIIGRLGATGRATGPHLDWRMSWRKRRVDPQLLVPPMP